MMPPRCSLQERASSWALPVAIWGSIAAVLAITVLCLASNVDTVFMHLYYLPLVLIGYYYRKKGISLIVALSGSYFALVVFFAYPSATEIGAAGLRTAMFILVGTMVAILSDHLEKKKKECTAILENVQDIIYRTDTRGTLVAATPSFAHLLGYESVEACIGKEMSQEFYFNPADRERFLRDLEREGQLVQYPVTFRHRDGHEVIVSVNSRRYYDEKGRVAGIEGVFHDITRQTRLEKELLDREKRYHDFFRTSQDSLFITSADGHWIDCNDRAVEMFGYADQGELFSVPLAEFYEKEQDQEQILLHIEQDGFVREYPARLRRRDGTVIDALITSVATRNPDGSVKHFTGTIRDITFQNRMTEALRASEEKFRNIFDSINDPIHIHEMDDHGRPLQFIEINDAACRMLQYSREELIRHGPLDYDTSYHSRPLEEIGKDLLTLGCAIFETEHIRRDGQVIPVEINAHVSTLAGKRIVVSVLRDITERKRIHEALRKSEEALRADGIRLANAMDLAHLVNWEFDVRTGMFSFDDRFYALYGTTAEREGGTLMPADVYVREFVHPEDVEMVTRVIGESLRITDPAYSTQLEHRIIRRDGQVRYIEVRFSPIMDERGNIARTYGANQDITEQKLLEEKIQESQHRLLDIINFLPDPTFAIDTGGRVIAWNKAITDLTGVPAHDVIGKGGYEYSYRLFGTRRPILIDLVLRPEDQVRRVHYPALHQEGDKLSGQLKISSLKGAPAVLWIVATPLRNESGKIAGAIESIRDITGIKKTEDALRDLNLTLEQRVEERTCELDAARNYTRSLIEADLDPLVLIGTDGRILDVNRATEKITGLSREVLIGTSFILYIQEPERARANFARVLSQGMVTGSRYTVISRDGSTTPIVAGSALIRDRAGKPIGVFVSLHDITRILQDEEKISLQLKEKEVLLREVHHRVKNNLQIIVSLIHLQEKTLPDPAINEALKDTQNRVRAIALVHERLHMSQDLGHIDIGAYLQYLTKNLFTVYQANPSKIHLNFVADPVVVDIDTAVPLGLILNELISNMLKYAFPGGREGECSISVHRDTTLIRMTVCDNGTGFPPDLDWTNPPSLGLRLVHILTEQLKGTITLERAGGTCFTLTIPIPAKKGDIHSVG